jgi:hypothetical protein
LIIKDTYFKPSVRIMTSNISFYLLQSIELVSFLPEYHFTTIFRLNCLLSLTAFTIYIPLVMPGKSIKTSGLAVVWLKISCPVELNSITRVSSVMRNVTGSPAEPAAKTDTGRKSSKAMVLWAKARVTGGIYNFPRLKPGAGFA